MSFVCLFVIFSLFDFAYTPQVIAVFKRAVAQGKHLGRPRIDPALEKPIQAQLRGGKGMLKVARECGVGSGTV